MTTPFHAKFWAQSLLLARPHDRVRGLARSIGNARVDLNPHQIDAALFALRSPLSKGALLCDEVGLGKTIEGGLVLAQRWAERSRKILLIVPATLRKQWQAELESKFFLPSTILETKTLNDAKKAGNANPFRRQAPNEAIVIASYQFVYARRDLVRDVDWDLVVVDEAHRLRSIYKGTKTPEGIVDAIRSAKKLLLTATPLQNSLMELYGLVSILDPDIFGDDTSFQEQFVRTDDPEERDTRLRERIEHVCKRTLRRQVLEYIRFTNRVAITADFIPSDDEQRLYTLVSDYLQREVLVALPNTRRKLITLIMRKLLASSSAAIGATLAKFVARLKQPALLDAKDAAKQAEVVLDDVLAHDYEATAETDEEWDDSDDGDISPPSSDAARSELADLEECVRLAASIRRDAKADALLSLLRGKSAAPVSVSDGYAYDGTRGILDQAVEKGARRKVVIFTESVKTQESLFALLTENGFKDEVVLMNGTNTDPTSKAIYSSWKERHQATWKDVTSGSKSADMKAAIVDEFEHRRIILLATESAAEGINLQFCSIVVNFDLPWNPQRIEQRIGRCHRYKQQSDVLVVNFLNRKNEADLRVFQLLSQKFKLFEGVFGASDEVLGVVESGVDIEKTIANIYQSCRNNDEIKIAFDELQRELDDKIKSGMQTARRAFLDNFDADVHLRLSMHKDEAKVALEEQQQTLLDLARFGFRESATFDAGEPRFRIRDAVGERVFHLDWQIAERNGDIFFRADHPEAIALIERALSTATEPATLRLTYSPIASALASFVGATGWLEVVKVSTTALGRREEFLVINAVLDDGTTLAPDVAAKLMTLPATPSGIARDAPLELAAHKGKLVDDLVRTADERTQVYFHEEVEKIEHRAEDLKLTLEKEIRELDGALKAAKRDSKATTAITDALEAQERVRALETRRSKKRRELYDAQDKVDADHEALLGALRSQLSRETAVYPLFTIRFELDAGGPS